MDTRQAIMRAVLDNPGDDTPRLMYADHLDELGGAGNRARAEFIRVQIGYANRGGDTSAAQMNRVAAGVPRAGSLLKKWGAGWLPRGKYFLNPGVRWSVRSETATREWTGAEHQFTFERGFVSLARFFSTVGANTGDTIDAADTIQLAKGLLFSHPVEEMQFEVAGAEPVVRLRFGPTYADLDTMDDDESPNFRRVVYGPTPLAAKRLVGVLLTDNLPSVRLRPVPIPF